MPKRLIFVLLLLVLIAGPAGAAAPFRFEAYPTLDNMRSFIEKNFPLGSPRADLQRTFVEEGNAKLVEHPRQPGVEKYLYDINLCDLYIFRWNISADYNADGKLEQAYVNGRFVFMAGKQPQSFNPQDIAPHAKSKRFERPRPEALKGRKQLRYRVFDNDGNFETLDDQVASGDGVRSALPSALLQWIEYTGVDPWRSIFDMDDAGPIKAFSPCTVSNMLERTPEVEILLLPELERLKREMEMMVPAPAPTPAPAPAPGSKP